MNICNGCIKSTYISEFLITSREKTDADCVVCGRDYSYDLSSDTEVLRMLEDNIRYYNSIFEYYSGEHSPYTPMWIKTKPSKMFDEIFTEELSQDVRLMVHEALAKYTDINNQLMFLYHEDEIKDENLKWWIRYNYEEHYHKPLKDSKARLIAQIEEDLQRMNHFEVSDKYSSIFREIDDFIPSTQFSSERFFRARKGFNRIEALVDNYPRTISFPYVKDEICSPPLMIAQSGRFNRVGCSFLYVASTENTAVSELRPEVSEKCTVADFKCVSDNKFMDVRRSAFKDINVEENLIILNILESLNRLFSGPILSHENNKYLVTQFLSDIIRSLGYSGVVYDSAQGDGFNVTGFEENLFELVEDSERIVSVGKITYEIETIKDSDDRKKHKDLDFERRSLNEKYLGEEYY